MALHITLVMETEEAKMAGGNMKKNGSAYKTKIKRFLEDRKIAFTAFVMEDDFDAAVDYCRKYDIRMPTNINVFKLGIYKAVLECTDIPENVKMAAEQKIAEFRKKLRGGHDGA